VIDYASMMQKPAQAAHELATKRQQIGANCKIGVQTEGANQSQP
jgi:hypothetical protein